MGGHLAGPGVGGVADGCSTRRLPPGPDSLPRGTPWPITISARWNALRADQDIIDRAAARLRHETAQAQYAGLRDPQVAFGFAAVLDELSRHLRDLDEALRGRVVELCTELLRANQVGGRHDQQGRGAYGRGHRQP
jgi:hypothetical protein